MADEVSAGGAVAPAAAPAATGSGTGAGSGGSAAPAQSDEQFLSTPAAAPETTAAETKPAEKTAEEAAPEEINLSALEEGQPEWLAKVTDPAVKAEVQKLLDYQKSFSAKFKDAADLDAFFKELPGGREQVAALQTLSKEVGELDGHLEANTPEGNAIIAERYLAMTPDAGVGLLRASAQHMAKSNPEAWNQISTELVNSTLKANEIGVDLATMVGAVKEMREAIQKDDGEGFGKAAGKLLGAPKAEPKPDANLARLTERETAARNDAQKAQTESWQFRSEKSGDKLTSHLATETGKLLSKVLPASIAEKDRASLRADISAEIMSQLTSNAYLKSQVVQLIGVSTLNEKGVRDHSKSNLAASQQDFDKATELVLQNATPKLIAAAVAKVVSRWSKDREASNKEARDRAKSATAKVDVGAGATPANGKGKKPLTLEEYKQKFPAGEEGDIAFLSY